MLGISKIILFLAASSLASVVSAHTPTPAVGRRYPPTIVNRDANETADAFSLLFEGNKEFRETVEPGLLEKLTRDGQAPPFLFIGCSDSRVSEGTIFNAPPGTLFAERNIANQFSQTDGNAHAILSYAVSALGVKHVIVMGHYGCGGVAASIASPPETLVDAAGGSIQNWIAPIRQLYQTSSRAEIVALREANAGKPHVEHPEIEDPGFRALIEENVKASVAQVASSSVIRNHFLHLAEAKTKRAEAKSVEPIFIHGFVYNIADGMIYNLDVSVGPPGVEIPAIPFEVVQQAGAAIPNEDPSEGETEEKRSHINWARD